MSNLQQIILAAVFAALLAVVSQLIIPIGIIPMTLQLVVVWLCGGLLGARYGTLSIVLWLLLAVVGLPVLAGGQGGIFAVFGPRCGFLLGFVVCAALSGLADKSSPNIKQALLMLAGLLAMYLLGIAGLLLYSNVLVSKQMMIADAIKLAVLPFIVGDVLKAIVAFYILKKIRRVWPLTKN